MKGFFLPRSTETKSQLLATLCKSTLTSLNNEDNKNIDKKFQIPTQTYKQKIKNVFPNFLTLYFLSPDRNGGNYKKFLFLSDKIYIDFPWCKLQSKTKVRNISHEI